MIHSLQALSALEYPEKLQRLLLTPQREVVVELVITKDNGEIETYNAYRHAALLCYWLSGISQCLIRTEFVVYSRAGARMLVVEHKNMPD